MSDLAAPLSRDLVEAWSRGEITRREIADRLDMQVGFGALLLAVHEHRLTLPRVPADPQSPGVRLVRALAERVAGGG